MIVGITGTQSGINEKQLRKLWELLWKLKPAALRHGDCIGADAQAHMLALAIGIPNIIIHPPIIPDKRAFCSGVFGLPTIVSIQELKSYLIRNRRIVDSCDLLIALPNTNVEHLRSGTWATVRYAQSINRPFQLIVPTGE